MSIQLQSQPYQVPSGYVDLPYCYVYNGTGLLPGGSPNNIPLLLTRGGTFILRHIAGVPTCINTPANGGQWNYQNANGSYAIGGQGQGIVMPNNWPVVPEKQYPPSSQILMSFYNALPTVRACGQFRTVVTDTQIGFFGVRRLAVGDAQWYETPYKYTEQRYTYNYPLTITWPYSDAVTAALNSPVSFVLPIHDYDFQLLRILISQPGAAGGLATNDFRIKLYDPYDVAMMSGPVNQGFLNSAWIVAAGVTTPPPYQGCFPVPPMTYPINGQIKFDITSHLCPGVTPQSYIISFQGKRRIPA